MQTDDTRFWRIVGEAISVFIFLLFHDKGVVDTVQETGQLVVNWCIEPTQAFVEISQLVRPVKTMPDDPLPFRIFRFRVDRPTRQLVFERELTMGSV